MRVNLVFRVKINSGFSLLLFLASFFLLLVGVAYYPAIDKNFIAAGTMLVGAFGGYLKKENSNDKLDLEAAKSGSGVVDSLTVIKSAVYGKAEEPCKNGDVK